MRLIAGLFVMLTGLALGQPNLVSNGDWGSIPPRDQVTNPEVSDHAGAAILHVSAGNSWLSPWKLTGKADVLWFKTRISKTEERFEPAVLTLGADSTLTQVLATRPGQEYRLKIYLTQNAHKPNSKLQQLQVLIDGKASTLQALSGWGKPTTMVFKATGSNTELKFRGVGENVSNAPFIGDVSVSPYDPESEKLMGTFSTNYRTLGGALERRERAAILDFFPTSMPDRAALIKGIDELLDQEASFSLSVSSVDLTETGAVVEVRERASFTNRERARVTRVTTYKDTWVKDGSSWKLESRAVVSSEES
jgi:hypothetical protein